MESARAIHVIVLTGAPGVGKTTIARALLDTCPPRSAWIDTDKLVAIEPWVVDEPFKDLLAANLLSCLENYARYGAPVVIVSGVIVLDGAFERIQQIFSDPRFKVTMYGLRASPAELARRIGGDEKAQDAAQRLRWTWLDEDITRIPGIVLVGTEGRTARDVTNDIATRSGLTPRAAPAAPQVDASLDEARALSERALRAAGAPADVATRVATELLRAELEGYRSHGLLRIAEYVREIARANLVPTARPTRARVGPSASIVDGARAFGALAIDATADELLTLLAEGAPLAAVALRASGHVGRLAPLGRAVARAGHALLGFVNYLGAGQKVPPWGGADARLATNPILMAFPGEPPIVVDLTTSAVSEGTVRARWIDGRAADDGWLIDEHYAPVRDAARLYATPPTAMLRPLGGVEAHKGFALALGVEVLAGIFSGAGAVSASPGLGGNGGLFIGIRADLFGAEPARVRREIDALAAYVRSSRPAEGFAAVRIPGDSARAGPPRGDFAATVEESSARLSVAQATWSELVALAGANNEGETA